MSVVNDQSRIKRDENGEKGGKREEATWRRCRQMRM
jgi:hypothetical protein